MKKLFAALAIATALGLGTVTASCAPAATENARADVGAERRAIEALEESWDTLWEAGDMQALVNNYYTDDAVLAATSEPEYAGRAAILANYRALKADTNLALDYRPGELWVAASGDLAVRTGTYANRYTDPATGQAASDAGRYVVVYRKQDGAWRAAMDIETSLAP